MTDPKTAEERLAAAFAKYGSEWRIAPEMAADILAADPAFAEAAALGLRLLDENDPLLAEALCSTFDLGHDHDGFAAIDPAGHSGVARDDALALRNALRKAITDNGERPMTDPKPAVDALTNDPPEAAALGLAHAVIIALREALTTYGDHREGCEHGPALRCTCGWIGAVRMLLSIDEALATPSAAAQENGK